MDETWEDVLKDPVKNQSENIKLSNVKKIIIISLPTYPPADSVGRQCQTNNILRVALHVYINFGNIFFLLQFRQIISTDFIFFTNCTRLCRLNRNAKVF